MVREVIIGSLTEDLIRDHGSVIAIDTRMHGCPGVTALYYLPAPRAALIETGPASSLPAALEGLAQAGVKRLAWIVVTHIHLDHAGAAGHLSQRYPEARVVVRSEGAPHLADPTRLWASASRLYEDMDRLWGRMLPIEEDRILPVDWNGPVADLGDGRVLQAYHAPGHARHQMALLEPRSGDLFVGDALGVFLPETMINRPATPPPDFHLEASLDTIERLTRLGARRVFPTHFGPLPAPGDGFALAARNLRRWVAVGEEAVRSGGGLAEVTAALRGRGRAAGARPRQRRTARSRHQPRPRRQGDPPLSGQASGPGRPLTAAWRSL
jgi:glyoxylase-like metal-dependent hydrolase (beta-lactamase superfamily II)